MRCQTMSMLQLGTIFTTLQMTVLRSALQIACGWTEAPVVHDTPAVLGRPYLETERTVEK